MTKLVSKKIKMMVMSLAMSATLLSGAAFVNAASVIIYDGPNFDGKSASIPVVSGPGVFYFPFRYGLDNKISSIKVPKVPKGAFALLYDRDAYSKGAIYKILYAGEYKLTGVWNNNIEKMLVGTRN